MEEYGFDPHGLMLQQRPYSTTFTVEFRFLGPQKKKKGVTVPPCVKSHTPFGLRRLIIRVGKKEAKNANQ